LSAVVGARYDGPRRLLFEEMVRMEMIDEGPRGLGGWLILPAIGLVALPLLWIYSLITDYVPIFREGYWEVLTTPGSGAYDPLWRSLLLFELIGTALFVAVDLVLIVLFFRKSPLFPRCYVAFLAATVAFAIGEFVLVQGIDILADDGNTSAIGDLVRGIIPAAIWIPYTLRSRRVRNTFVERDWPADARQPQAAEQ
jgi:hypothetical protein